MGYELALDTWAQEEREAIIRVLDSGFYSMGPEVAKFETEFAEKFGSKYAVMVSSGSSANLVATASLFYKKDNPLKAGDEVIVPCVSWATTYYPLMQYGLKLRFVDSELDTLNMDVSQLDAALTERTKMIVGVSILGNPADLVTMRTFADRHGLAFLEDNCESMGAHIGGKYTGTFGDMSTFSFFFSHHIGTAEGGMILTDNEELYHLCIAMRAHGWTRNLPEGSSLYEKRSDDFYEAYRFILPGYNARPTEFSGAVGRVQLQKLDQFIDVRRKNAAQFCSYFQNDARFIIQKEHGFSSWFSFPMIVNPDSGIDRNEVFDRLKRADIKYRIVTGGNFLRHDVIKYCDHTVVGEIKNANIIHDWGFFVGNAPIDLSLELSSLHEVLSDL